ncbi:MAG: YitT family protein [Muribaculaceae bacterium]|nr:YitT family protein [Muribaculaceae bacterium]
MKVNRRNIWLSTRDYVMIILGTMLYSFGFTAFILPEKVVIGGVTGIGTLVYFVSGIPVGLTQYVLNLILLAFAYRVVGKQFVFKTLFGATLMSLWIGIMQPLFPDGIIEAQQPFMNITVGGLLCGLGLGFVFIHNGSTGGTDIVAAMVSKKTNVSIGRTMIYVDFCIISSSYLITHNIDTIVYGLLVLLLVSFMTDYLINTNRQAVQFIIFSHHWEAIATAINNEAHRGCTVLDGLGWYTKQEVKLILVVCRKIESVNVYRIIKSIDPKAFITQGNVNGVYGQGFDELKLKMRPKHKEETDE